MDSVDVEKCPYCGSTNLVYDGERGQIVCRICGSVINDRVMDLGPEWRSFNEYQRRQRERAAILDVTREGMGLGSRISGGQVTLDIRLKQLKELNERIRTNNAIESRVKNARKEVERVKYILGLSNVVIETAMMYFRRALRILHELGNKKRVSTRELLVYAVYCACKEHNIPRDYEEIKRAFNVSKLNKASFYLQLISDKHLRVENYERRRDRMLSIAERVVDRLEVKGEQRRASLIITQKILEGCLKSIKLRSGKSETSLTAAALYIALRLIGAIKRQKDIANEMRVSDLTIRKLYKEIVRELEVVIEV